MFHRICLHFHSTHHHFVLLKIFPQELKKTIHSYLVKILGGIPDVPQFKAIYANKFESRSSIGNLPTDFIKATSTAIERIEFYFALDIFWSSFISIIGFTSFIENEKILSIIVPSTLQLNRDEMSRFILTLADLAEKCLGCRCLRILPSDGYFSSSIFTSDLEFAGFLQTPTISTGVPPLRVFTLHFS